MPDYSSQLNQQRAQNRLSKKRKKIQNQVSQITDVELFLVLGLSVSKDIMDWVLLFAGGIGLILSRITNLAITAVLWLWCFFRLHKFPTKRFLGGFVIEMIPLIGTFSPTWTIFIATIWAEQKGYMPNWLGKLTKAKI